MKPRMLSADGVMLRSLAIIGGIFIVLGVAGTFQRGSISAAHPSLMQSNGDMQQLYEASSAYKQNSYGIPARSIDMYGASVPRVAREVQPPGFFTASRGSGGIRVSDQFLQPIQLNSVESVNQGRKQGGRASSSADSSLASTPPSSSNAMASPSGTMPRDQGWEAPYGNFKDISLGLESEVTEKRLANMEEKLQKYRDQSREELESVERKLWKEKQRVSDLMREKRVLGTSLQSLEFKWKHGGWPVKGARGLTGLPGVRGPAGSNGARGVEGPRGKRGAAGKTIVIKKTVDEHDGKAALNKIVQQDIAKLYGTSNVLSRLKNEISKMRLLKSQDNAIIQKLKKARRIGAGWTTGKITAR